MTARGREGLAPVDREALLRKYRLLARWRRAKDESATNTPGAAETTVEAGADPAAMRSLAEEFPGALRELDLLGLVEIERRIASLEPPRAAASTAHPGPEPWMAWIIAYHQLMRSALAAKRSIPDGAASLSAPSPDPGEAFHREVMRPPSGRLSVTVLQALARRFNVPAADIATMLFPPRRSRPER